ncbi:hypothetical protein [Helicobacter felis]|uniref:hypothetical protein n=1 Tax=Helicobacter felis TaxID=214 RepID=UPI0018F8002A|nr:hypothetical protein [Helicobacter felis]
MSLGIRCGMGNIASINFKKTNNIQLEHNDRTRPPTYLLIKGGKEVECDRNAKEARELRERIVENAKKAYQERYKQKSQAKEYLWSAVLNLKETTTMQDLKTLAQHFLDKYGFQCYQIAIHRDEGHVENIGGKEVTKINHHAHMEFVMLDRLTGKSLMRNIYKNPKALSLIQTEVAQILNMQRGVPVEISLRERVEPRVYARVCEQRKQAKQRGQEEIQQDKAVKSESATMQGYLTPKQVKKRIAQERQRWIENREQDPHTQEEYLQLFALKKEQRWTVTGLEAKTQEINTQHASKAPQPLTTPTPNPTPDHTETQPSTEEQRQAEQIAALKQRLDKERYEWLKRWIKKGVELDDRYKVLSSVQQEKIVTETMHAMEEMAKELDGVKSNIAGVIDWMQKKQAGEEVGALREVSVLLFIERVGKWLGGGLVRLLELIMGKEIQIEKAPTPKREPSSKDIQRMHNRAQTLLDGIRSQNPYIQQQREQGAQKIKDGNDGRSGVARGEQVWVNAERGKGR